MRIGFIGLGVMGRAMAGHLAAGGHEVTGYDRDPEAGTGLLRADSAAEAVTGAEIVITMLPHGGVVQTVAQEIAPAMTAGALLIDTSSSQPWLTLDTAELLSQHGVRMVDAPVSGAEWGAQAAELVFMAGGTTEDVDDARPLFDLMGRAVHHVGPLSAGHAMKALNNVITAATVVVTAEAMEIGRAYGLDPGAMVDVLDDSTGQSWWSTTRLRQDVLNGAFQDGFKLGLMRKDVDIACALADRKGIDPGMLGQTRNLWREAEETLGSDRAVTEMARFVSTRLRPETDPD